MATRGVIDAERGTDETFDFLCTMCKGKNKNMEAVKFCSDCNDYYCSTCVKVHDDVPILKNHQILDKAQFQIGLNVTLLAVPTERCSIHKHKPVDMYCKNHDVVACSACMLVQHSVCKDKFYMPDFINNSNNAPNSQDIEQQLQNIAKHFDDLKTALNIDRERLKRSKDNSLKQIQKFRADINQRLDELEKSTVYVLDKQFQTVLDKSESELKELLASATALKAAEDSLKSAGKNLPQMFVSVKIANHVANRADEIADTIQNQVSSTEILFVTNQKLMSLLSDMQVFGDITLKEKILSKPQTHKSLQQVTMTQTSKKSDEDFSRSSLMKIEGSKKYNVKVNSDKSNCNIINLCILEDGTIILADHCNKNLKRMDPSTFTVRDSCDVPHYPHQVVAISNREVAVSCSTSKLIQFVSVENTMKMTRQITGYDCCGLAFADGKLFVSSRISIVVISLSGDRQQLFGLDEFTQSRLAVSSDNSKIYVTGHNKCFVILDRNGSPVGGFNGPELRAPYDVCLDKNGNMLICGFNSKNVLQFSPGGKLTGEVLKTEKQCQALCCDKKNTKLIVGFNREDEIEVYDISGK